MEEKSKSSVLLTLGKNIRTIRLLKGFSQEVLAEKLNKSVNFVSLLELGKTGLSLDTLISLCTVLEVDTNSIFAGIVPATSVCSDNYISNALNLFEDKDKAIVTDLITYIFNSKH